MPPVLRTKKDYPAVSLSGVGVMPANAVGGILLSRAAESLRELQDDDSKPLEGADLKKAAKQLAEERGWDVGEISDDKVAKLSELNGGFPDRPAAVEVAQDHPFAAFASTSKVEPVLPADPTQDQPAEQEPAAPAEQTTAEPSA